MYHKIEFAEKKSRRVSSKVILPVLLIFTIALIILVYVTHRRHFTVVLPVEKPHGHSQVQGAANEKVNSASHVEIIVPGEVDPLDGPNQGDTFSSSVSSETYSSSITGKETFKDTSSYETHTASPQSYPTTLPYSTPREADTASPQSYPTTLSYSTPWEADEKSPDDDQSFLHKLLHWDWGNSDDEDGTTTGNIPDLSKTVKINVTEAPVNYSAWQSSSEPYSVGISNTTDDNFLEIRNLTGALNDSSLNQSTNSKGPIISMPTETTVPVGLNVPTFETSLPSCPNISSSNVKDIITNSIRIAKGWQREAMKDFEKVLRSNSDLGVIDARGGLSLNTLIALGMGRKVVVLEPNHNCAEQLRQIVGINGFLDLVTIKEVALLHKSGYGAFMSLQDKHFVGSLDDPGSIDNDLGDNLVINTITLNDLAVDLPFDKAVLCLDTAESQPSIFNAATSLFETVKMYYVFMTWGYDVNNDKTAADTISFLSRQNFEPREKLQNGFSLILNFYRYWPQHIVWVNKQPW